MAVICPVPFGSGGSPVFGGMEVLFADECGPDVVHPMAGNFGGWVCLIEEGRLSWPALPELPGPALVFRCEVKGFQ